MPDGAGENPFGVGLQLLANLLLLLVDDRLTDSKLKRVREKIDRFILSGQYGARLYINPIRLRVKVAGTREVALTRD